MRKSGWHWRREPWPSMAASQAHRYPHFLDWGYTAPLFFSGYGDWIGWYRCHMHRSARIITQSPYPLGTSLTAGAAPHHCVAPRFDRLGLRQSPLIWSPYTQVQILDDVSPNCPIGINARGHSLVACWSRYDGRSQSASPTGRERILRITWLSNGNLTLHNPNP